jgi:hypothetical protein
VILLIVGGALHPVARTGLWMLLVASIAGPFWMRRRFQRRAAPEEGDISVQEPDEHAVTGETAMEVRRYDRMKRCPFCAEEILAAAIKCKHCGSRLDSPEATPDAQSAAPPTSVWKRPVGNGSIFGLLSLVIAGMWMAGAFDSPKATSTNTGPNVILDPSQKLATAEPTPTATVYPKGAVFKISADDLDSEYEANEVATDEKIGDAVVEVSGTVVSIDKSFRDHASVGLHLSNSIASMMISLIDSQKPLAAKLVKGKEATFRCEKVRRILSTPTGSNCLIVFSDKAIVTSVVATVNTASSSSIAKPKRETYVTTADQLFKDYAANEVATDDNIDKAYLEITGVVNAIDKDAFDSADIKLQTSSEDDYMIISLSDSEHGKAASLSKGQTVVARCNHVKRVLSTPIASGCILKSIE